MDFLARRLLTLHDTLAQRSTSSSDIPQHFRHRIFFDSPPRVSALLLYESSWRHFSKSPQYCHVLISTEINNSVTGDEFAVSHTPTSRPFAQKLDYQGSPLFIANHHSGAQSTQIALHHPTMFFCAE